MIGFYLYCSHPEASDEWQRQLWGDAGTENIFARLKWEDYGTEIREMLVGLYVKGHIDVDAPKTPRIGRVSAKDKSLRIDIALDAEQIVKAETEGEVRRYVVASIAAGLRVPESRRRWDFDFAKLASDFLDLNAV